MMQGQQMQQLRQRVIASYHLGPMDKAETQAYIEHRLVHVGWKGDPRVRARRVRADPHAERRHSAAHQHAVQSPAARRFLQREARVRHRRRAGDRPRDPRGARSGDGARGRRRGAERAKRQPHAAAVRAAMRARGLRDCREIDERIDRLEKTVGAAVDLLHRLLHPDQRSEAGRAREPLMSVRFCDRRDRSSASSARGRTT